MQGESAIQFAWEAITSPDDGPGLRSRHCLVYDSVAKATILFGGIIWDARGTLRADTWELRDGRWSRIDCPKSPPARHRGSMGYDQLRRNSVLFGGEGSSGNLLKETWTYADGHWHKGRAGWWASRPSARCGHCVVAAGGEAAARHPLAAAWSAA
jgi:hypothetical protein